MTEAANLHEAVEQLEIELGLKKGFFSGLLKEDDWSFVVKLESLIESACTYLLVKATNQPNLEGIFSRLEIANKYTGKIAFIKSLNLLEEKDRAFVHALAELRNSLVHNVRRVASFSFQEYVESLDDQQSSNLVKALFGKEFLKQINDGPKKMLKDSAKFMFWLAALECLGSIYVANLHAGTKYSIDQKLHNIFEQLILQFEGKVNGS